ncbi:uncharacterized protein B0H18DRAFT_1105310 [Fomitopsis serialis]|uniref:uncharacterized protein n=1 Tax=Fomitopsis serialis TaxID=139415 RepID=UPI002007CBC8|nr:uncharacterized protein B0H18DRAFT_1105310 [Neoantrodia serialis]KAH9923506.1 hypothetical protein B0H18DRAFT_1105310 [Neoantrodia serialis]
MPPLSGRKRKNLSNLAKRNRSSPGVITEQDSENTPLLDVPEMAAEPEHAGSVEYDSEQHLQKAQQASMRLSQTFAEISRPTWAMPPNPATVPGPTPTAVGEYQESVSSSPRTGPESPSVLHDVQNTVDSESDHNTFKFRYTPPPDLESAHAALDDLEFLLRPPRANGIGTKPFKGDDLLRDRMTMMCSLFWCYAKMPLPGWIKASETVAHVNRGGPYLARCLRGWCQAFIADRHDLPFNPYGTWNKSILETNDELKQEIEAHLQSVGKYVCAADIVQYMARQDVHERHGLEKGVCLSTAHEWMRALEYRWTRTPRGQFIDGHERDDVVAYRQGTFLPEMLKHEQNLRQWKADGTEESRAPGRTSESLEVVIGVTSLDLLLDFTNMWFGDQSTFYANDRRELRWVKTSEKAKPRPKGEGASLMVGDFVSADYGFLQSKDGSLSVRTLFKAGKNRDGYFQSNDVLDQLTLAMDILDKDYPCEKHVFVIDNAPTHLKRADDALSARKMPKGPSKNFAVVANVIGPNGKVMHGPDGKILKHKIRMGDAHFSDGRPQSLYFPDGHERAGEFKGMAQILKERGHKDIDDHVTLERR